MPRDLFEPYLAQETDKILQRLGVPPRLYQIGSRLVRSVLDVLSEHAFITWRSSPITGEQIASVRYL
jgi:hypothetical protein